jgi:hypothetical protein
MEIKNKRSQTIALAFMLAIVVLILALAFVKPLNQMTTLAMNTTSEIGGMDCDNTVDKFVKAGCITADIGQAYIIGGLISIAGLIIGARLLFE